MKNEEGPDRDSFRDESICIAHVCAVHVRVWICVWVCINWVCGFVETYSVKEECGEKRETQQRLYDKGQNIIELTEEIFSWRLVKEILSPSAKETRAKFQSAKDTAQEI